MWGASPLLVDWTPQSYVMLVHPKKNLARIKQVATIHFKKLISIPSFYLLLWVVFKYTDNTGPNDCFCSPVFHSRVELTMHWTWPSLSWVLHPWSYHTQSHLPSTRMLVTSTLMVPRSFHQAFRPFFRSSVVPELPKTSSPLALCIPSHQMPRLK